MISASMKKSRSSLLLSFAALALLASLPALLRAQLVRQDTSPPAQSSEVRTQPPSGKRRISQEVQITGDQSWSDTGIDVRPAEHIDVTAPVAGRLAIGINQASDDTGEGTYTVHIEIHALDPNAVYHPANQVKTISGVDAGVLARVPRRIADKAGDPADMVNFLILGSEDAMQKVFATAGWVKVDADVRSTVLHGILEGISKESYLTMPMSQLYLFGRPQDYGWAHAEPIKVVASRNHLRIWKAPFQVDVQTLWVGAATHDIGFERDERDNGVTHKIDPDIDLERDYVEKTFTSTGLIAEVAHALPANPLKEAKTATGGSFHSDGRVLILK